MNTAERKEIKKLHSYLTNTFRTIDRQMKWVREDYGPDEALLLLTLIIRYCEATKVHLRKRLIMTSGNKE